MFKEETVFILGAGASWHYGYPTGATLIDEVIKKGKKLLQLFEKKRQESYYSDWKVWVIQESDLPKFEINTTREDIVTNCQCFISLLGQANPIVIDYFLSKQEPHIREIGKFLIAWVILECEYKYIQGSQGNGSNNYNQNRIKAKKGASDNVGEGELINFNDDWYRFVLHKLVDSCDSKIRHTGRQGNFLSNNNVKFITFNYDVSLEFSLLRGLNAMPGYFSDLDIRSFMESDRFLHVYGAVRNTKFGETLIFKTDEDIIKNFTEIYEASKLIKTIGEDSTDDDDIDGVCEKDHNQLVIDAAQLAIKEAKNVYILGYGFDPRNNTRIGLGKLSTEADGSKKICFTNYEDYESINKRINKLWGFPSDDIRSKGASYYRGGMNIILPHDAYSSERASAYQTNYYDRSTRNVYEAFEKDFDFL
jgi:hypothetical protein